MFLKEKVKNLPSTPGVYLMKDSLGSIIYVGKSKNLKSRVGSYFQNSKAHSPKVLKLVKNLKDFDYILTDTEFEAFMLECKLIREIKPIYNRLMKSPQSYTYIRIQMNAQYPMVEISNYHDEDDHNLYFGPYTSKSTVERALQGIKEYYKISCSIPSKKNTTCFNYSLGLCIGMCLGGAEAERYSNIINKVIAFLNGTDREILEKFNHEMFCSSENFDFETAAKYRDYIAALNFLLNKEKVIEFTEENKNIVMIEQLDNGNIKLFLIKGNKILLSENYKLDSTDVQQLCSTIKSNILDYFSVEEALSSFIQVSSDEIDAAQIIYNYLKGNSDSYIIIPQKWLCPEDKSNIDKVLNKYVRAKTYDLL